ncbi:hypothetical protein H5410_005631 [Solanum commersonii]|uniref:F-box/kelch-repeat protein n=1 Tax=Solanum commersonii TaxID=4109 RepID=A0A9J6A748_SOLCO|nr:hypothetical protein H5410_005631 [Solanum commersonii]
MSLYIHCYSSLTNMWSYGMQMNAHRCLFVFSILGEISVLSMNKPRKKCFGVFMDGMFYVIGGIGGAKSKWLTCVEEYDPKTSQLL